MKKYRIIPTEKLLGSAITFLLFTLLATGMTGCKGFTTVGPSDTQNAERQEKREAVRKQIEAVLTPDQVKQLEAKLQQGEKMRQALSSLDLTADQKTKIQGILKAAYPQRQQPAPEASPQ